MFPEICPVRTKSICTSSRVGGDVGEKSPIHTQQEEKDGKLP
jgi:hypothetical protein